MIGQPRTLEHRIAMRQIELLEEISNKLDLLIPKQEEETKQEVPAPKTRKKRGDS